MSDLYGPGPYGDGAYSGAGPTDYAALACQWPLNLALAANLQLASIDELAGVLSLQPLLQADLTSSGIDLDGVLAIQPAFSGALSEMQAIAAAWSLSVSFATAPLASTSSLAGAWTVAVAIEVPNDLDIYVGPLWALDAPCPPPLWTSDTPCADPGWQSEFGYTPSAYGVAGYGEDLYSFGYYGVAPAPWTPSELCHA